MSSSSSGEERIIIITIIKLVIITIIVIIIIKLTSGTKMPFSMVANICMPLAEFVITCNSGIIVSSIIIFISIVIVILINKIYMPLNLVRLLQPLSELCSSS